MLLTALALLAVPQGQVHVVDAADGPGAEFTTIYAAVAAAADGDVLLIRGTPSTPDYPGFIVDGKGLTLVADTGDDVRTARISIWNMPATSQVLVQGLSVRKPTEESTHLADLYDNRGPLWFERCNFELLPDLTAVFGLWTVNSDAVVLSRCTLQAWENDFFGSAAFWSENSRAHVFDSTLIGVPPYSDSDFWGAAALRYGSFLELFGSTAIGGNGYDNLFDFFLCDGYAGGDAVSVMDMSTLVTLDSDLLPGSGGQPFLPSCDVGNDGLEVDVSDGTYVALSGAARSLEVNSPVREGEAVNITTTGLPGDRVWVKYSFTAGTGISSSFYDGENLLGAQRFRAYTAMLPASGTAVSTAPAPQLAPGQESLVVFCQAFFLDAAGTRFVISSPSACVVLDASF